MGEELVVTRFAPSPTGHLHIGGARTALFCWALARGCDGRFLVRIEDTDRARSTASATRRILDDLAWLGIAWDEGPEHADVPENAGPGLGGDPRGVGPFCQAERLALYDAQIERLIERDLAYPAFDSEAELDAMRNEARAEKRNFLYRQPAGVDREAALERMRHEEHVVRFRMPDLPPTVVDAVLGEVEFGEELLFDFIIRKRDGYPTFHLAVVVDDEHMGVSHVLRGQEHLNNTPRHVALQQALGFHTPVYAHLPLIFNPDGSKMSKRDKDKAVRVELRDALGRDPAGTRLALEAWVPAAELERWLGDKKQQLEPGRLVEIARAFGIELPGIEVEDFRRAGYLPEVVCNFLALLGWSPGLKDAEGRDVERFGRAFLAENFSLDRIGRSSSRFDRAKLLAFNQEAIAEMADGEFFAGWSAWARRYDASLLDRLDEPALRRFASALRTRCRTLADLSSASGPGAFALVPDDGFAYDEKAVQKFLRKGDPSGLARLREAHSLLGALDPFDPESIEDGVRRFCEQREIGMGKIAQPLRVAVTGSSASPPLGDTLAILGRDAVLRRIDRCLEECAPG